MGSSGQYQGLEAKSKLQHLHLLVSQFVTDHSRHPLLVVGRTLLLVEK